MRSSPTGDGRKPSRKRAVIIESQRLFVPYLSEAIRAAGADVVRADPRADGTRLAALQPDVVVLDAAHSPTPALVAIRAIRRALPVATIVVYTNETAPWTSLARALGADVVLGSDADGGALVGAFERIT